MGTLLFHVAHSQITEAEVFFAHFKKEETEAQRG